MVCLRAPSIRMSPSQSRQGKPRRTPQVLYRDILCVYIYIYMYVYIYIYIHTQNRNIYRYTNI